MPRGGRDGLKLQHSCQFDEEVPHAYTAKQMAPWTLPTSHSQSLRFLFISPVFRATALCLNLGIQGVLKYLKSSQVKPLEVLANIQLANQKDLKLCYNLAVDGEC